MQRQSASPSSVPRASAAHLPTPLGMSVVAVFLSLLVDRALPFSHHAPG
jgi:hypothetical protein